MHTFTVKLSGISILYPSSNSPTVPPAPPAPFDCWRVIIPFISRRGREETCHRVTIKINGRDTGIDLVSLKNPGDEVTIEIDPVKPDNTFNSSKLSELLNITDSANTHKPSELSLIDDGRLSSWHKRAMLLKIPTGKLETIEGEKNYKVFRASDGKTMGPNKIGVVGIITFEAESLTIRVYKTNAQGGKIIILEMPFNTNTDIHFDNDCHEDSELPGGDFQYIYSVFDATDTLSVETYGKTTDEKVPCHLVGMNPPPPNLP